jgi:hypothetical protein
LEREMGQVEIKVVINRCYGGFGLSEEALAWLKATAPELNTDAYWDIPRDHPALVRCVEELGSERASDKNAKLKVVSFYVDWDIKDYDGKEHVVCNGEEIY